MDILLPIKLFWNIGYKAEKAMIKEIGKLPLINRIKHPKMRRHCYAISLGGSICLVGSFMATNGGNQQFVAHFVWDAFAYTIHGIGLSPIICHIDPAWRILMGEGEAEEREETEKRKVKAVKLVVNNN